MITLPVMHFLFFLPYGIILCSGGFLLAPFIVVTEGGNVVHNTACLLLGLAMTVMLLLYGLGIMGNHYVKVYSMFCHLIHLLVAIVWLIVSKLFLPSEESSAQILRRFGLPQLLFLFWLPLIYSFWMYLKIPNISEIIPGKLYLGNAAAGTDPDILDEHQITHILRLQAGKTEENVQEAIKVTRRKNLYWLECTDTLYSEHSLSQVAPDGVKFISKALNGDDNHRILVHCSAGCSRSPAMVAYWLFQSRRVDSVPSAIRMIRIARPIVDISSDHMISLERLSEGAMKRES